MISIQYIAGFFDADGSVFISAKGSCKKFRRPSICLTNADRTILEDTQSLLGGSIYVKNRNRSENVNLAYDLQFNGAIVKPTLELLYPHVRHVKKKERIRILLEEYYPLTRQQGDGVVSYSEEVVARKLEVERRFNSIIMRGKGAYSKEIQQ